MSGFFWNIRGLNKSNKQLVIQDWVRNNAMDFGCLLETKVKAHRADRVVGKIFNDWSMVSNYEFSRLGRIWVVWSKKVTLQVVYKSAQMITCSIRMENILDEFWCSFIYASNFVDERKDLWTDIQAQHDLPTTRDKPWLILGDFNETLNLAEHSLSNIAPMVTAGMRDFQDLVRNSSLSDLKSHGPIFTWCNKREDGLICKKLDRVLRNDPWLHSFPHSYCVMEPGGCSDHLRGRIFLKPGIQRKKPPFKFTNALAAQPEFFSQLEGYWVNSGALYHSTSSLFRFTKKLKELKPIFRALGRNILSDLSRKAKEAYSDLCARQLNSLTNLYPQDIAAEAAALERWERVAGLEEAYLKQKSKLHWLKVGDRNNKFFYNTIKER